MERYWLSREGRDAVAVFVLGWAADHRMIEHLTPTLAAKGYDMVAIYDFRPPQKAAAGGSLFGGDLGAELGLAAYGRRALVAWSFGVWAAERLFPGSQWDRAVALCGSPLPLDERFGLGRRRISLTLRGVQSGGMEEFFSRSLAESYRRLEPLLPLWPGRDAPQCADELEHLAALAAQPYAPSINWDRALVGSRDMIFPPANLSACWGPVAELHDMPHYPFDNTDILLSRAF
ncbi:hypothetical protein FACS1894159_10670 [Bacteroidia bacterium]|nr:hypothetical protein FACS1894159_10670 [Bacteroidia bacterium]